MTPFDPSEGHVCGDCGVVCFCAVLNQESVERANLYKRKQRNLYNGKVYIREKREQDVWHSQKKLLLALLCLDAVGGGEPLKKYYTKI